VSEYTHADLEHAWQLLMVIGEDRLARAVAEAKQRIMRYEAQARGEPQVIHVTMDDTVKSRDGAG
jgi:hypothetical protein